MDKENSSTLNVLLNQLADKEEEIKKQKKELLEATQLTFKVVTEYKDLGKYVESLNEQIESLSEENANLRSQLESKAPGQRKPFNLERALAGDPVVTREGRKVIRITHFPESMIIDYRLVVLLENQNLPDFYCENGNYRRDDGETPFDLFMAPRTETRWFNHYSNGTSEGYANEQHCRKEAEEWTGPGAMLAIAVPMEVEL